MKHQRVCLHGCADACFFCGILRYEAKSDYCKQADIEEHKRNQETDTEVFLIQSFERFYEEVKRD